MKKLILYISLLLSVSLLLSHAFQIQITHQIKALKIEDISINQNPSPMEHREISAFSDYREHAWLWTDPSGWVHAHAEVESSDLGFGDQSLNLFLASYLDIYSIFDHAHWEFSKSDNPEETNSEIRVTFRTNDAILAKNYANIVMEYTQKFLVVNYDYESTRAWEDWRDDADAWVQLTDVTYRGRVDWPWFVDHMNNSLIPRNLGGLAETIDVSEADWIEAWAWPRGSEQAPEVGFAFGFNFGYNIWDITGSYSGSHSFNMNDLLHVEKIQRPLYQSDELWINFNLPDVQSITHNPSTNTSNIKIYKNYHPPSEPWWDHHYWDVNFVISGGIYYDLSVSFNYKFIAWALQNRMRTSLYLNPYGYEFKEISLQGFHSNIIDFFSLTTFDSNLFAIEMQFWPLKGEVHWNEGEERSTLNLNLHYPDYEEHYTSANAIAIEIENLIGIDFNSNWTDTYFWEMGQGQVEGHVYRFDCQNFNLTLSQNLLSNSEAILSTPAFKNQDLATINDYAQNNYLFTRTNTWRNISQYRWNSLEEEIINPTKRFYGTQQDTTLELLTEWNWPSFPFCANYSSSEFNIIVPYDDYSIFPSENNGWGWYIDWWEEDEFGDENRYISGNLYTFTDAASLQFTDYNNQPNGTTFDQFGVLFDFTFHDDNEDLIPPGVGLYHRNDTTGHEEWDLWRITEEHTFSGYVDNLHVRVGDHSGGNMHQWSWPPYYWNGTHWHPRFGSSGISSTKVKAYFTDLPVRNEKFEQEIPITLNWANEWEEDWILLWNTTEFADGEWTIVAYAEDNLGFVGRNWFEKLSVDNYDEAVYTQGPMITILNEENTTVSGTHTVQVQVTDDIGVFAVVLTKDGSGWILNDTDGDNIHEFSWNTLADPENSYHYFTITSWDMDGHKEIYDFWLQIDNIPSGNPPAASFISPSSSNQPLTGMYRFQVNAMDDNGIVSVMMQIDDQARLVMNYNTSSGFYERIYNVSSLMDGHHWITVNVTDVDDNQHMITILIDFTVFGGQIGPIISAPPEWNPSKSILPENLTDYVQQGKYLEYNPESGDIYFKIAVKDDNGIAGVNFRVYIAEDFDSATGEPTMDDVRLILEEGLGQSGIDGDWALYEHKWDSATSSDNFYVCEFDVQDMDTIAHHLYIRIVIETDNTEEEAPKPPSLIPGFEIASLLLVFASWIITRDLIKRKKEIT
ncbi:MAG: hypothetical protein ACFFDT_19865 [Candidatus Hodarchaeota archaeon]